MEDEMGNCIDNNIEDSIVDSMVDSAECKQQEFLLPKPIELNNKIIITLAPGDVPFAVGFALETYSRPSNILFHFERVDDSKLMWREMLNGVWQREVTYLYDLKEEILKLEFTFNNNNEVLVYKKTEVGANSLMSKPFTSSLMHSAIRSIHVWGDVAVKELNFIYDN